MHAQYYKWPQPLHNYVKSLFPKRGAKGHGVRQPDQHHFGQLPLPYIPLLQGLSPYNLRTDHLWRYSHGEWHWPVELHPATTVKATTNSYISPFCNSSRCYNNSYVPQYIEKTNTGYWTGDLHTKGPGTRHPGYNLELMLQSLPPWG